MTRLGARFKIYQPYVSPLRVEVAKRIAAFNQAAGAPGDWAVPAADRARIRTEVAPQRCLPSPAASRSSRQNARLPEVSKGLPSADGQPTQPLVP